jgi:YD repeat-containing protein
MRKKNLFSAVAAVFFLCWFLGSDEGNSSTRPVKTITKITALRLFDRIPLWTFDKSVKQYNRKGQLVSSSYYNGHVCDSRYVYTYTPFDSLHQTVWLTGEELKAQRIDVNEYDSLHRLHQQRVYQINQIKADTFPEEQTAYFYNQHHQRTRTVHQLFNQRDTSVTTAVFAYRYNPHGLVSTRTYTFRSLYIPTKTTTTQYRYDPQGRLLARLEEDGDSIYYLRNRKGQVIEERQPRYPLTLTNKYWYDARGNQIKAYLDIDEGRVYDYTYDAQNRLRKVSNPGSLFFILNGGEAYAYEYY